MLSQSKPELLSEKSSYLSNIIVTVFAIAWLSFPLLSQAAVYRASAAAILIVELPLLFWLWFKWRALPSVSNGASSGLRRTYNRITGAEMAAIFLVVVLCRMLGQPGAIGPAIAIVVGLHFIPLAKVFRIPLYNLTATMLVLAGVICLVAVVREPASMGTRLAVSYAGSLILLFTATVGALKLRR